MVFIPKSPWKQPDSSRASDTTSEPAQPKVSNARSEKVYECCWDLAVHGTLLSLMNIVTFKLE